MSPPARDPSAPRPPGPLPARPDAEGPVTPLPAGAQLPALALVLGCAVYLLGGFVTALDHAESGAHSGPDLFWLGRFRMFTELRPHHVTLAAERHTGAGWETVSLPTLYRSRWPEGPGYLRNTFRRDPKLREQLADSLCGRVEARRVRLSEVRWPKLLGTDLQRRPSDGAGVQVRVLGTYSCPDPQP